MKFNRDPDLFLKGRTNCFRLALSCFYSIDIWR
jgi:hypothetical protein